MSTQSTSLLSVVDGTDDLRHRVREAIGRSQDYLLSIQNDDGHWCGELEGDTILESEYVLTMHFLGRLEEPKVRKAAQYIRRQAVARRRLGDLSRRSPRRQRLGQGLLRPEAAGGSPDAPHMVEARRVIRGLGGIEACNSFTKIYLSIFGQYDWRRCPAVPPEILLLPRWFYFNIYEMSSWSRAILVPLSIIWARKPHCAVPRPRTSPSFGSSAATGQQRRSLWASLFHGLDVGIKVVERLPFQRGPRDGPQARRALDPRAPERQRRSGSDLPADHQHDHRPARASATRWITRRVEPSRSRELETLEIEEEETAARAALLLAGLGHRPGGQRAGRIGDGAFDIPICCAPREWLLGKRGHGPATGRSRTERVETPGWYFEYANEFYPDCDTTAQVHHGAEQARCAVGTDRGPRCQRAVFEAHHWHLAMQNRDGGWGAFDKGCDKELLTLRSLRRPQRDDRPQHDRHHGSRARDAGSARLRPRTTRRRDGRSTSCTASRRRTAPGSAAGAATTSTAPGWRSWGLKAIGEDTDAPWAPPRRGVARAAARTPTAAGASCRCPTTMPSTRAGGPSTASQTAWALLGLMAVGRGRLPERRAAAMRIPGRRATRRRLVVRRALDRHRLPRRLLPALPPLPDLLPAAGAGHLPARARRGANHAARLRPRTCTSQRRRRGVAAHEIPTAHHDRHDPAPGRETPSRGTSAIPSC